MGQSATEQSHKRPKIVQAQHAFALVKLLDHAVNLLVRKAQSKVFDRAPELHWAQHARRVSTEKAIVAVNFLRI